MTVALFSSLAVCACAYVSLLCVRVLEGGSHFKSFPLAWSDHEIGRKEAKKEGGRRKEKGGNPWN